MILPELHGKLQQTGMFVYSAFDNQYFDEFAEPLVNSVLQNTKQGLHLHIYNPREDQLASLENKKRISYTWEYTAPDLFDRATNLLIERAKIPPLDDELRRSENAMGKSTDTHLRDRMQKTYYACARFIRMAQLVETPCEALMIDSDAVVRNQIPLLDPANDIYLHRIDGRKARFLAGGIYLTNCDAAVKFINHYAQQLTEKLSNDYMYWGLDQDILENLVPQYIWGRLPRELIDWNMTKQGIIWTAKGTRKDDETFQQECNRYRTR